VRWGEGWDFGEGSDGGSLALVIIMEVDKWRQLRTACMFLGQKRRVKEMHVFSNNTSCGLSLFSANLAESL
jgi:hypothetical protein